MNYLNRDGYKIGFLQVGDTSKCPIFVVGSAIYYPRLFNDALYKALNLVFIDHRGFLKPEQENVYDLDRIIEDIEAVRCQLGFDSFYLLGHSGHGFMAMAYAQKYPNHIEGLILSNLAPTNTEDRQLQSIKYFDCNASDERKAYFEKEFEQLPLNVESDPQNRFTHMNICMQAHSFLDFKFNGAYLWEGVYNNLDALDYLWGEAYAKFDTAAFFKSFKKPLLLLLSDHDYLVAPTKLWDPIIEGTNTSLHKFEKSSHNPMFEEPQAYFDIIDTFVKTC